LESGKEDFEIRRIRGREEVSACAEIMAGSEPWITLKRTYEDSVKMLGDPARETYVALAGGSVVGFLILRMDGVFSGYIQTVGVAPQWRGRRIGSGLIGFAEKRIFRERPNVFMCVSSFNPDAMRLYQRLGYEVIGELRDFIVRGHSEIFLRKSIAPMYDYFMAGEGRR
jgi:ribosomal-protein-alanine N-acetyltransferase